MIDVYTEDGEACARRVALAIKLEQVFGLDLRGEQCVRSFDGWRQIKLCNAAKGEIFTRRPVK